MVQVDTARLIALFVGCILYGILLTTFVSCLRSLLFSASQKFQLKSPHEIKWPILAVTIMMFFVSTFSAAVSMKNVIDGFISYTGPGGALAFYEGAAKAGAGGAAWTHWMPALEDSVQVILGDGLLIYRCYVLYDRNWRAIIAPAVAWVALIAMSLTGSIREAMLRPDQSVNDPSVLPFLTATLILTLLTSVVTTYLIIRRLLTVEFHPSMRGTIRPHILTRIATTFLETGLIYTLSVIASLGVYITRSSLEYVATLAVIHIIPITCNLLLIRVEGVHRAEPMVKVWGKEQQFNYKAADEV